MEPQRTRPVEPASEAGERPVPAPLRVACLIVALESLALVVAAVILVIKLATQTTDDLGSALLLVVVALAGAAALFSCARNLLRQRPAARSPTIVLQLLALPTAYTLAFQADRPAYGGPILVAALAVLYLLFTPPVRAVLNRMD